MGAFVTPLEIKECSDLDSGTWELEMPLVYQSSDMQTIIVPKGFVCDLASVPRLPVIYALCGNTSQKAATVHDYLYRKGCTPEVERDRADWLLRDASESQEVSGWRRWMMWCGVRAGGWASWKKKNVWDKP
jgi:hypothetical protein